MDEDGAESWRLTVSVRPAPFALEVRDALRLDTSVDELSPPPLIGATPDRRELLSDPGARQAARRWATWWRNVLHYEALVHGTTPTGDILTWYQQLAVKQAAAVGEPPAFDALADTPALQRAVVELARELADRKQEPAEHVDLGGTALMPGTIATELAVRHGVPVADVRGVVLGYPTHGRWWRVAEPGVLVCSIGCLSSDESLATAVRAVFESSLQGSDAQAPSR